MADYINTYVVKKRGYLRLWASAPFIYGMIIPAVFLHICTEIYQQTAFRLYAIDRVAIKPYITDIRRYLPYLHWIEKIHCWYCSYVNGVFGWAVEVAKRTEQMWCPIKNAKERMAFDLPHRQEYPDYGNEKQLQEYFNNK